MIESSPSHIAIFLGAGASSFAKLPTVNSFFRCSWPPGEQVDWACSEIARRIAIYEGTKENMKWPDFDAEKIFAWLEILEKVDRFNRESGQSVISNSRGQAIQGADLISRLRRKIVKVYGPEVDSESLRLHLHRSLFKMLDALTPKTDPLYLFTTNYDTLLEQLFEGWGDSKEISPQRLRICTGFRPGRAGPWEPELYEEEPKDGERLIRLIKLHGSVTWKRDSAKSGRPVETGWREPTEQDCLLYFGYKSIPEQEPFIRLHDLLKTALLRCETMIAIGFRFADPYIREVFNFALEANPKLRIICSLTRIPDPGSPLSVMMERFPRRVDLLVGASGEPIPFGHDTLPETLEKFLAGRTAS